MWIGHYTLGMDSIQIMISVDSNMIRWEGG